MYTKTKIKKLSKDNKILYYENGWKLIACYNYDGLIAQAIFNNHFTKTCYRQKDVFIKRALNDLIFPIYIIKNEEKKYFRQIEIKKKKIFRINYIIFEENNIPVGIRNKDIPEEIKKILPKYIKYVNDNLLFLNEVYNLQNPKKNKKNIYNYGKKIYLYSDKKTNDYFILTGNKFINNINNNKKLFLKASKIIKKHLKNLSKNKAIMLIIQNKKFISL